LICRCPRYVPKWGTFREIIVHPDKRLALRIFERPPTLGVTGRKKCLLSEANGGASASLSKLDFPPLEVTEFIPFFHTPLYFDGSFLHQKYVVEGLSAAQIAGQVFSSKSTILKALKENEIELREAHQHHGNPALAKYGKKKWAGREIDHASEQKVINAVIEMHKANMGLRQIART